MAEEGTQGQNAAEPAEGEVRYVGDGGFAITERFTAGQWVAGRFSGGQWLPNEAAGKTEQVLAVAQGLGPLAMTVSSIADGVEAYNVGEDKSASLDAAITLLRKAAWYVKQAADREVEPGEAVPA